jgi:hypothetical protein
MARSIRIPGLADIKKVDNREALRALSADPGLDRRFEEIGPPANRMVVGRVNGALRVDGKPLPSVAPRDDADRMRSQQALHKRLDPAAGPLWDQETLAALVAAVRGKAGAETIGPATQQAVGRLFNKAYVGDTDSYQAARDLDDAVRTRNPARLFTLNVMGQLRRSRSLLTERVNGDLAGVHGTGIAVHNMVRGFEKMRELWAQGSNRPSIDEAARACLFAPETVLRQATRQASTAVGDVSPGTLVMFELGTISEPARDAEAVFMAGTWAECPAGAFVVALLRAVWEGALAAEKAEPKS